MAITLGCQSSDTGSIPVTRSKIQKTQARPGFLDFSGVTGIERRRPRIPSWRGIIESGRVRAGSA